MKKQVELKDGREILIRPMMADDLEGSVAFFTALPEEDRAYLRRDVTNRDVVRQRFEEMESGAVQRLVAEVDGEIVADGALEISGEEWKKHLGEIRLIVARPFRRQGLGVLMTHELYDLATAARVEEIIVKLMGPQEAGRGILERLGFEHQTTIPDYVQDLGGGKQDMILMRCDLEALWRRMEDFLSTGDWEHAR
ncbi:MAG: GNAT family N-acetyltransferase [Acidobacteria bacterium]|nr:MAG: GNAT family N-acetyltransferase [Acidobacteriota bacterium]